MRAILSLCLLLASCKQKAEWLPQHIVAPVEYPALANVAQIQGLAEVECDLTNEGTVEFCRAEGHAILSRAAIDNVRNWTLERPARFADHAVRFNVPLPPSQQLSERLLKSAAC